jgi:hypothetical protein
MSAREGKFWKSRLENITFEYKYIYSYYIHFSRLIKLVFNLFIVHFSYRYKKWREISRKQIKTNNDGNLTSSNTDSAKKTPEILPTSSCTQSMKKTIPNSNTNSLISDVNNSSNISSHNNNNNNLSINNTASSSVFLYNPNQQSTTVVSSATTSTCINVYESHNLNSNNSENNFYSGNNTNNLNNINNTNNVANLNNEFSAYVPNNNNNNSFSSNPSNISVSNSYFIGNNNSQATQMVCNNNNINNYNQQQHQQIYSSTSPISMSQQSQGTSVITNNKQMPYNNRYPSPSPGLFQDIDLYNFSSDTLFSTYLAEDPKDNMFGTNPDFFQPDLMHLYALFLVFSF